MRKDIVIYACNDVNDITVEKGSQMVFYIQTEKCSYSYYRSISITSEELLKILKTNYKSKK